MCPTSIIRLTLNQDVNAGFYIVQGTVKNKQGLGCAKLSLASRLSSDQLKLASD